MKNYDTQVAEWKKWYFDNIYNRDIQRLKDGDLLGELYGRFVDLLDALSGILFEKQESIEFSWVYDRMLLTVDREIIQFWCKHLNDIGFGSWAQEEQFIKRAMTNFRDAITALELIFSDDDLAVENWPRYKFSRTCLSVVASCVPDANWHDVVSLYQEIRFNYNIDGLFVNGISDFSVEQRLLNSEYYRVKRFEQVALPPDTKAALVYRSQWMWRMRETKQ